MSRAEGELNKAMAAKASGCVYRPCQVRPVQSHNYTWRGCPLKFSATCIDQMAGRCNSLLLWGCLHRAAPRNALLLHGLMLHELSAMAKSWPTGVYIPHCWLLRALPVLAGTGQPASEGCYCSHVHCCHQQNGTQ